MIRCLSQQQNFQVRLQNLINWTLIIRFVQSIWTYMYTGCMSFGQKIDGLKNSATQSAHLKKLSNASFCPKSQKVAVRLAHSHGSRTPPIHACDWTYGKSYFHKIMSKYICMYNTVITVQLDDRQNVYAPTKHKYSITIFCVVLTI